MTQAEREHLIEQYLQGRLSRTEEQDFFIEVATDKEMQYDLKASQVVESAIRKDRDMAPASWSKTRGDLAATLLASKPGATEADVMPGQGKIGIASTVWVPAIILITLVSFSALLISLVAINQTSSDSTSVPVVIKSYTNEEALSTEVVEEEPEKDRQSSSSRFEISETNGLKVVEKRRGAKDHTDQSKAVELESKEEAQSNEGEHNQPLQEVELFTQPIVIDTVNPDKYIEVELEGLN